MRIVTPLIAAAFLLFAGATGPNAATVAREIFTFDATLTSGTVLCGPFVGTEVSCPSRFGTYSGLQQEDLLKGRAIGDTVSGQIVINSSGSLLESASCLLGGRDCLFATDFLAPSPIGATGTADFTKSSVVASIFDFSSNTYRFATDYIFDADGVHYYTNVRFSLSNVNHAITEVPLPVSAAFLLAGIAGMGVLARRRRMAT